MPRASSMVRAPLGWWLTSLGILLSGYALCGKSFAYLGVPPLFVGEMVLVLGLFSTFYATQWHRLFYMPFAWLIFSFILWGALQTLPYVSAYQIDALRDAALFGYSAFALMVMAHLITRPERLEHLLHHYDRLSLWIALISPVLWLVGMLFSERLPKLPWANLAIIDVKSGDVLVHLAGVFAFWIAYPNQYYSQQVRFWASFFIFVSIVGMGSESRGGLLAFISVGGLCFASKPQSRMLWQLVALGLCVLMLFAVSGMKIPIRDRGRDVSFDQIGQNLLSIANGNSHQELEGTKSWRIDWWHDILNYTFNGKYFWTGKGFGVNLADDDGYQVVDEAEAALLRSPHNAHMTFLARAGVPGLLLWVLLLATWSFSIARAYLQAQFAVSHTGPEYFCGCLHISWRFW